MRASPSPSNTNPTGVGNRLLAAAFAGGCGGIAAALFDTWQAACSVNGALEVVLVWVQTTGHLGLIGGILGLTAAALGGLGQQLAKKVGRPGPQGGALALTLAALPGVLTIAIKLFQGGYASRLPARPLLIGIIAITLTALCWLGAKLALRWVHRADGARSAVVGVWIRVAALVGLTLAVRYADAHLYRRLYLYLHFTLAVLTLAGFGLAVRMLILRGAASRRRNRFAAGCVVGVALLFLLARVVGNDRHSVRVAVSQRTTTAANLLQATAQPQHPSRRPSVNASAAARQQDRRIRALAASAQGWPVLSGAHIVILSVDALRADRMGMYGYTERQLTENLDRWAAEQAVIFDRAYCPAPHSSYSLTSLHTSHYTHDEAVFNQSIDHPTLAEILERAGYTTVALYTKGIFFTEGEKVGHYRRTNFGFSRVTHGAFRPHEVTDRTTAEIDRIVKEGEGPSVIWVHYFNVHEPYRSTRFGTAARDRYEGEIYETDAEIALLLDTIARQFKRPTIIALTSDHGEEFKDHGGYYHGSSLYEEQIRVPLIIRVPGAAPKRIHAPVSTVGLAATLLRLVGLEPPSAMTGQDLRPAIFGGEQAHVAEPVFSSVMRQHMALVWPWKLIADPSRNLYELYNLKTDPLERVNRFDQQKETGEELLQEIYGWLDEFVSGGHEARTALNLGHMRDPRAVPGLLDVALNTGAPEEERLEALELLGEIEDRSVADRLIPLLDDGAEAVAIHAALTLAKLGHADGRELLYDALFDEDSRLRNRVAIALARLRDTAGIPVLIDALGSDDLEVRHQAIRMLGGLRDRRAVEPLIEAMAEERTRYLTVLALGKIGDPRAYDIIIDTLNNDTHVDVRGYAVVALGWLGMPRAVPRLARLLQQEPGFKWTTEALIRLEGVGRAPVFGTDIAKGVPALRQGWGRCQERPHIVSGEYLGRTSCRTLGRRAVLRFWVDAPDGATVILRARHLLADKGARVPLVLALDGQRIAEMIVTGAYQELRTEIIEGVWSPDTHRLELSLAREGALEVDHLVVLAR